MTEKKKKKRILKIAVHLTLLPVDRLNGDGLQPKTLVQKEVQISLVTVKIYIYHKIKPVGGDGFELCNLLSIYYITISINELISLDTQ